VYQLALSHEVYGFATSLPGTMFQIRGDVKAVGFPVQNAYKMPMAIRIQPLNP